MDSQLDTQRDSRSVESLTTRLRDADLRGSTRELAAELPRIHRELVATLGPDEAERRFNAALAAAIDLAVA